MSKNILHNLQSFIISTIYNPYTFLTIEQSYSFIDSISEQMRQDGYVPDIVVGVSSGGNLPAQVLARRFNTELTYIDVDSYKTSVCGLNMDEVIGVYRMSTILRGGKRPDVTLVEDVEKKLVMNKRVLIVDDDSYTGRTLDVVTESLRDKSVEEIRSAVLYTSNKNIDYVGKRFSREQLQTQRLRHPWSKLSPYFNQSYLEK